MSEYQKLIRNLDGLKNHCGELDTDTLQEAMDIISDYEKVAAESARMTQHYETQEKPVRVNAVWVCPACRKRTMYHHSHCHWCGKKLGWDK